MDPQLDRVLPVSDNNKKYQYFDSICFAPGRVVPLSEKQPFLINEEPLFKEYLETGIADIPYLTDLANMRGVKPNRTNVTKSLDKCDTKPVYPNDDIQDYVRELVYQYLGPYLTVPVANSSHKYEYNTSSSPGKFWKRLGCPTKGDAFKHPLFMKYLTSIDHIPICDYNGKIELLNAELISEGKIRGTFNPQVDFIGKQKFLYDNQNEMLLKNNELIWIKYGFVKQYGGIDRMCKKLESCSILSDDDCIGYDRIAYLGEVYRLRNHFLQYDEMYQPLVDYVTYFTMHAYVACPDGVIRRRATGNISGSNNTTTDNSILHVFIEMRFIVELFIHYMGRKPTLEECISCVECYIYSDDNTCGYKLPFSISLDEFYIFKQKVYRRFGFELKPEQKELSHPAKGNLNNHSFLGSFFFYDKEYEMYIPYPRVEKIASSLFYTVESHEPIDTLAKAYALTVLSCMVPQLGEECRKFLQFLLSRVHSPEKVLGFEGLKIINNAIHHPKIFYLQHMGRQSSSIFLDGGWNKKMDTEAKAEVMNDIPKIEKRIDTNIAKVGGSEEGSLWVKESLDPFNDCPRKHVGFPDLIVGNTIVQAIRQSVTFVTGGTTTDVHIFMDCLDTNTAMYENTNYTESTTRPNTWLVDAVSGIGTRPVGGLTIRSGAVGATLGMNTTLHSYGLPRQYLNNGSARVLAKAFEITNTTPKLTAGGAICVYRNASSVPYEDCQCGTLMNSATPANNLTYNMRSLGSVPESLKECIIIPGSQQWSAIEGCYCVGIMSNQTNNPQEEDFTLLVRKDSTTTAGKTWLNTFSQGTFPSIKDLGTNNNAEWHLFSPFFQFGAYLSGLPANTSLTIDYVWIIERFPDPSSELVTLANPSPYYDPIALELYSKSAQHLPHGVKKGANADGDWIKNIADVLSNFGVPGMPLVKGAVDLWNGFNSKKDPARKVGRINGIVGSPNYSPNAQPKRPQKVRERVVIKEVPVRNNANKNPPKKQKKKKNQ